MARSRKLNDKEEKLLATLGKFSAGTTLAELAKITFPSRGSISSSQGNSWVRNCLRKLVTMGYAVRIRRGVYKSKELPRPVRNVSLRGLPDDLAGALGVEVRKRGGTIEQTVRELLSERLDL